MDKNNKNIKILKKFIIFSFILSMSDIYLHLYFIQ